MKLFGPRQPNRRELRALARDVWGDEFYFSHRTAVVAWRVGTRARIAVVGLVVVAAFGAGGYASVLSASPAHDRLLVDGGSVSFKNKPGHGKNARTSTSMTVDSSTVASTSPPSTNAPTPTNPPTTVAPRRLRRRQRRRRLRGPCLSNR